MNKEQVKRLIKRAGGVRAVARVTNLSTQNIYQWLAGLRPVPQRHKEAIEMMGK